MRGGTWSTGTRWRSATPPPRPEHSRSDHAVLTLTRHAPRKRGIQYTQVIVLFERPVVTGSSAFADDDDSGSYLPDGAACAQPGDVRLGIAGRAQNLIAVLADAGRLARRDFVSFRDPERRADSEHGVVGKRHQHVVRAHLLIAGNILQGRDGAGNQIVGVENGAPDG